MNKEAVQVIKQMKTLKTNMPSKHKHISPNQNEDKTKGDRQSNRIKDNLVKPGNTAATKGQPQVPTNTLRQKVGGGGKGRRSRGEGWNWQQETEGR